MKQQQVTLKIGTPCGQRWYEMTQNDRGRLCSQCSKTVIDFTHLTDSEIIKIINQSQDKLCGRLSARQLNRCITTKQQTNYSTFYKVVLGLLFIGNTQRSNAEMGQEIPKYEVSDVSTKPNLEIEPSVTVSDTLKSTIYGKVIDEATKEPILFASVTIKNTDIGVTTDIEGKFNITIPENITTDTITLVVRYVGYENTEMTIDRKNLTTVTEILVISTEAVLMGDMIIIEKQKKWWQRK